ncbi:hypothetical protein V1477_001513 [Vespula maculifrons]|uniref:Uncharacterized protein n=1 Tax=Vespula maculifrons TaxID=7453 RepID=A0ABD2CZW6_VESMC
MSALDRYNGRVVEETLAIAIACIIRLRIPRKRKEEKKHSFFRRSQERPTWHCFIKLGTAVRGNGRDLPFSKDSNVSGFDCKSRGIVLREICRRAVGRSTSGQWSKGD